MAANTQMGGPVKGEPEQSIPLECILCPKAPTFSDTSHLLTHISSKSHLHHKFNTEFKAKSELDAREKLCRYEHWYSVNGIERLLAERIAAKTQKRPSRRGRSSTSSSKSRQSTSTVDSIKPDYEASPGFQTPDILPPLGHWDTGPGVNSIHIQSRDGSYNESSMYQTPAADRHRSAYYFADEVASNSSEMKQRAAIADMDGTQSVAPSDIDSALALDFLDGDVQDNKLKGVVWPGMALFDSATPDQKRKRNQRKDGAVIEHMKSTSEAVLASETVWGPEGDVRKVRDIYASPSLDGSPPSSPQPKKKQRPRNISSTDNSGVTLEAIANDILKEVAGDEDSAIIQRGRTHSVSGSTTSRQTRARPKAATKSGKAKKVMTQDTNIPLDDSTLVKHPSFNGFYEGPGASPGDTESQLGNGLHENGFDPNHQRSALQQLDPNLTISEATQYFKHTPGRFFENGTESPHLSSRQTPPGFPAWFHGMNNGSLSAMASQPRSGAMYPQFDNQMLSGNGGSEPSGSPFPVPQNRRLSYGGLGIDGNHCPYGFHDQRDPNLRESSYPDQGFRSPSGLFDM